MEKVIEKLKSYLDDQKVMKRTIALINVEDLEKLLNISIEMKESLMAYADYDSIANQAATEGRDFDKELEDCTNAGAVCIKIGRRLRFESDLNSFDK